jgi:hypothetical protein
MKRNFQFSVISILLLMLYSHSSWSINSFSDINNQSGSHISVFPQDETPAYPAGVYNVTTSTTYPDLQSAISSAVDGDIISCGTATTYSGLVFSGSGFITILNTSGGIINIIGSSPALIITGSGTIKFDGFSFNGVTGNDPSICIYNGKLVLRNSLITASTGFSRSAIQIAGNGLLDAGLSNDLGKNTFICLNDTAINNLTAVTADAIGNWWGNASGPNHSTNPGGTGFWVSDYVNFLPYALNSGFTASNFVDIGIFNAATCGNFEVRLKPGSDFTGNFTGIVFTIRWESGQGFDQDLQSVAFQAPYTGLISQQGLRITTGGYNYVTFAGLPDNSVNWTAGNEISLMTFSLSGTGTATIPLEITNDNYTNTTNRDYSLDIDGLFRNGLFYHQAYVSPLASWSNTLAAQCSSSTFYTLTGGTPTGGTYSGSGVTGTNFDASSAGGSGSKTLTYTYSNILASCSTSATNSIFVNALPVVSWSNSLTPQCISATSYTLAGGSPSGGTYSGSGVTGSNFDASVSGGAGIKTLTYSFTDGNSCTNSATNSISVSAVHCGIYIKTILQGAYDDPSNQMRTDLQIAGILPQNQPYNSSPWNYTGTEQHSLPFPSNVVDWVLVELRGADHLTSVTRKAALLLNDGTVADVNGTTPLYMTGYADNQQYYVAIYHRNHLVVMTAIPVSFPNTNLTTFDFTTDPTTALWGGLSATIPVEAGVYGMITGDINNDNYLIYSGPNNDRGLIIDKIGLYVSPLYYNSTTSGYFKEDLTMNNILQYSGLGNDQGIIFANIDYFTTPSFLNTSIQGPVPLNFAKSGKSINYDVNGPLDIFLKESSDRLDVILQTNELISNSFVDNIQFCISWDASHYEINDVLESYESDFSINALGPVMISGQKAYQIFGMVDWKKLPENFIPKSNLRIMSFRKNSGLTVSNLISLTSDSFVTEQNGNYYISVAGHNFTGKIRAAEVDYQYSSQIVAYPNPSINGEFTIMIEGQKVDLIDLTVCDMSSKVILNLKHLTPIENVIKLELENLSSGAYQCLIKTKNEVMHCILFKD